MRRRTLLAGLAAGLAGCSASSGGSTETPTLTPVDPPSETPSGPDSGAEHEDDDGDQSPFGDASVVDLETGDRTLALSPTQVRAPDRANVEISFAATATADHPARLAATLTNENDWTNTFRLRQIPGFADVNNARLPHDERPADGRETTVYLAPTSNHDLVDADPSAKRGPEGYWQETDDRDAVPKLPETVRLDPGESVTGEYALLGQAERKGFPTGSYEFGHDASFSITAWRTSRPGPRGDSRFDGRVVRPFSGAETMAWFHATDAGTEVYLAPSDEAIEAPGRVTFTLVNHAREALGGNPARWGLHKYVDGDWFQIAPWAVPLPASAVPPGGEYVYHLHAFHGEAVRCDGHRDGVGHSVGYLGGGTYAFEAGFARDEETHAALFEVVAPAVEPTLTDDATVTDDGARTVVTMPQWGDGDHPPDARLHLRPVDAPPDRRYLPEQVMQRPFTALRNAMAVRDRGREVVVRADEHRLDRVVGFETDRIAFEYEGRVYEARVESADD